MTSDSLQALRAAVVSAAQFLVQSGILSLSHHGNFSVRVPDTNTMLLTGGGSLDSLRPDQLALVDLSGALHINPL